MSSLLLFIPSLLVIALLAWLLRDISSQQARRGAARLAAEQALRDRFKMDMYPFVKAFENMARQVTEVSRRLNAAMEASPALRAALTPASPSLGEDGGDAGTTPVPIAVRDGRAAPS